MPDTQLACDPIMEGYIKLTAPEFVLICNVLAEYRAKGSDNFLDVYKRDFFGPPWHYGDDGNLYIQEVN